jgi:hypothetical protein
MKRVIFLLPGVLALLIFAQIDVLACGCVTIGNPTLEQRVKSSLGQSKIAFSGIANEVSRNAKNFGFTTKFKVDEYWKGLSTEEIIIIGDGSSCEYPFTVGEKYLVYAYISKDVLTTGACIGNTKLVDAAEELKILGKGEKPKKSKPSS